MYGKRKQKNKKRKGRLRNGGTRRVTKRKMDLKRTLKDCKRGVLSVKEYTEKKKEYREWIKKKKKEWNERIVEEIEGDRSVKNFCGIVNEQKKGKQEVSNKIKKEEWMSFLREKFKGMDMDESERERVT